MCKIKSRSRRTVDAGRTFKLNRSRKTQKGTWWEGDSWGPSYCPTVVRTATQCSHPPSSPVALWPFLNQRTNLQVFSSFSIFFWVNSLVEILICQINQILEPVLWFGGVSGGAKTSEFVPWDADNISIHPFRLINWNLWGSKEPEGLKRLWMILGGHFQNFPACRSYQDPENSTESTRWIIFSSFLLFTPHKFQILTLPPPKSKRLRQRNFFFFL